jgi:hypothetical protein
MKLKLLLPFVITAMWFGTVWGAQAGGTARQTGIFLPSIEIQSSVDGLEARDSNNNIVANTQVQQGLRDIFLSGLFSLLMQGELYTYARACAVLSLKLGFGAQALTSAAGGAVARVVDAILSSRTWKNILAALMAVFAVAFIKLVLRFTPSFAPPMIAPVAAPVFLRC